VEQLAQSSPEQLTAVKGVGEKTSEKLIELAKQLVQPPATEPPESTP
jgi:hypothetical protein